MNATSGEYGPEVDEFERAGLQAARAESVDAPFVADCPAVLECRLFKEVRRFPGGERRFRSSQRTFEDQEDLGRDALVVVQVE
jgi:hypothetical protein